MGFAKYQTTLVNVYLKQYYYYRYIIEVKSYILVSLTMFQV